MDLGSNPSDSLGTFFVGQFAGCQFAGCKCSVELPFCLQDVDTKPLKHSVLRFLEE